MHTTAVNQLEVERRMRNEQEQRVGQFKGSYSDAKMMYEMYINERDEIIRKKEEKILQLEGENCKLMGKVREMEATDEEKRKKTQEETQKTSPEKAEGIAK